MAGRLNFSKFESVKTLYTRSVGSNFASAIPLYKKGHAAFYHALGKFGINNVFADPAAQLLLEMNDHRIARQFAKTCSRVPEFSLHHSPDLEEEIQHDLMNFLTDIFGKKAGMKIVLSSDCPDIYILKDEAAIGLFRKFGLFQNEKYKRVNHVVSCPTKRALANFLMGAIPEKDSQERLSRHVRDCGSCADEILKLMGEKPPMPPAVNETV